MELLLEDCILKMHCKIYGGRGTEICLDFSVNNYQHAPADFAGMH